NQVTNFGKFMDPLADKMLVVAGMCWFVERGQMLGWILAAVLLREFAVSGMRLVAVEQGIVIAAGWSGKVKTAVTMIAICVMLLVNEPWMPVPSVVNMVCQLSILVTTLYSGVEYFYKNRTVFQSAD
ncbi:MAG: CDP-alcohol phosphatidyltransferase family protein, partial [Oscillospiraceae bacterium]